MPTGSLSKLNIPLGFGLRKGIRLQTKNHIQPRTPFHNPPGFCKSHITNHPSSKTFIPKPPHKFGNLRKDFQVAGVINLHSPHFFTPRTMATSGSVTASGDLIVDNFISSCGNVSNFPQPSGHFLEKNTRSFHTANMGIKNREPNKIHGVHGYFIFGITHTTTNISSRFQRRCNNTSSSTCYSDGKESSHDESSETITSLAIETDS